MNDDNCAAVAREWCQRTRAEQGLPPTVTDLATLHRVLVLLGRRSG